MPWKYVGKGASIPTVPMRDMSDEEFERVEEQYEAQFGPEGKGSLRKCGLYRQEKSPAEKAEKKDGE